MLFLLLCICVYVSNCVIVSLPLGVMGWFVIVAFPGYVYSYLLVIHSKQAKGCLIYDM